MKIVVFVNGLLVVRQPIEWIFKVSEGHYGGLEASLEVPKEHGSVRGEVVIQVFSEDGLLKSLFEKDEGEPYEDESGWGETRKPILVHRMSKV